MYIVFVKPSEDIQTKIFKNYNAPSFGAAFDLVLTKWGFLDIRITNYEDLENTDIEDSILLMSYLPEEMWNYNIAKIIANHSGKVIIEGPVPSHIRDYLGLPNQDCKTCSSKEDYVLEINDALAISARWGNKTQASIAPPRISTVNISKPAWENFPAHELRPMPDRIGDVFYRLLNTIIYRAKTNKCLTEKPDEQPLALLLLVLGYEKLPLGPTTLNYRKNLEYVLTRYHDIPSGAYGNLVNYSIKQLSKIIGSSSNMPVFNFDPSNPWDYLVHALSCTKISKEHINYLTDFVYKNMNALNLDNAVALSWFLYLTNDIPDYQKIIFDVINKIFGLKIDADAPLSGISLYVTEAIQYLFILQLAGYDYIVTPIIESMLDESAISAQYGYVRSGTLVEGEWQAATQNNWNHSPWLALLLWANTNSINDVKRGTDGVACKYGGSNVIKAWQNLRVDYAPIKHVDDNIVLGIMRDYKQHNLGALIISSNSITCFQFQIFNLIGYHHTVPPLDQPVRYIDNSSCIQLEELIVNLIRDAAEIYKQPLLQVEPWPAGYNKCLTIRHDVDRLPKAELFSDLIEWEKAKNMGVSWYWIANRVDSDYISIIEEAGFENGLHAVKNDDKSKEISMLRQYTKNNIYGECTHQGGGSDEWLGPLNQEAGYRAGYSYCITQFSHAYPFRMIEITPDGIVKVPNKHPWCLSYISTVDRINKSEEEMHEFYKKDKKFYEQGYHTIITNHPDINFIRLKEIETNFTSNGRLDWTAAKVIEWWSATHDINKLRVQLTNHNDGAYTITINNVCEIKGLSILIYGFKSKIKDIKCNHQQSEIIDHESTNFDNLRIALNVKPGKNQILLYSES